MKNPNAFTSIIFRPTRYEYYVYVPGRYILRDVLHKPFQNNILKSLETNREIKMIQTIIDDFRKSSGI